MSQVVSSANSPAVQTPPLHPPAVDQNPALQTAPSVTHEVIQDSKGVGSHPAVSVLTALLHDDSTRPSAANVKVSQVLQNGGDNFQVWMYELIHAAISKECVEAFQKPLPCTRANAAAIMLLTSSTPV